MLFLTEHVQCSPKSWLHTVFQVVLLLLSYCAWFCGADDAMISVKSVKPPLSSLCGVGEEHLRLLKETELIHQRYFERLNYSSYGGGLE